MRTKINIMLLVLIGLFVLINKTSAQFSADADGILNVSSINGSMSYTYPISNHSIDGHPLTVKLSYASNVAHSAYEQYHNFNEVGCDSCDGWTKYTKVYPEWIFSVNNIAINIFGRTLDYSMEEDNNGTMSSTSPYDESYVNWMIDGYDYSNRMQALENNNDHDVIKILKGDGSILELRNIQKKGTLSSTDTSLYKGYYYTNDINSTGFALVDFDTTSYWPSYFKDGIRNNRTRYLPRIMKYYPGDGLEYVFREHVAPYGTRALWLSWERDSDGYPTIFYLEEINSSMGIITEFTRKFHNPTESEIDVNRGRRLFVEFAGHKITGAEDGVYIEAFEEQ